MLNPVALPLAHLGELPAGTSGAGTAGATPSEQGGGFPWAALFIGATAGAIFYLTVSPPGLTTRKST